MQRGLSCVVTACLASSAWGQVIDFEGVPGAGNPIFEGVPVIVGEFQFISDHFHTIDFPEVFGGADNDTLVYIGHEGASLGRTITMSRVDAGDFGVFGLDVAEAWITDNPSFPNASAIRVTGFFSAGGSITTSLPLDGLLDGSGGIDDFQSYGLAGFIGLSSFEMNGVNAAGTENFACSIDNIVIGAPPIASLCFGDGTATPCPCANDGGPGEGCANGTGGGGVLRASGTPSVSADSLSLAADGVINNNGLFFQGNNTIGGGAGTVFGDGIRCCGGGVVRIQVVNPPGSTSPATAQMTETATTNGPAGTITAGTKKCYQYWYRDPATSPCGAQFNLTNAVTVTWAP